MLLDTHLHLDLFNRPKEIVRAIENQKHYSIAVTNLPKLFKNTQDLCKDSKYIRPALGYHPELVYKFNNQFELFCELICETRYVGEIGIDNLRKTDIDFNFQKLIFEKIIGVCGEKKGKILTIHSRRAEKEVISIVGDNFPGKVILHWYSGSSSNIKKALSYGFYFSVNHVMTQSQNGIKIIKDIPLERLLIESDSPFIGIQKDSIIAPDLISTISKLSILYNISFEDLSLTLSQNFKTVIQY